MPLLLDKLLIHMTLTPGLHKSDHCPLMSLHYNVFRSPSNKAQHVHERAGSKTILVHTGSVRCHHRAGGTMLLQL